MVASSDSGAMESRQLNDLEAAASGGGHYCPEGIPVELGLLSILAAFGVAFGILYRALTVATGRRKRSVVGEEACGGGSVTELVSCGVEEVVRGAAGSRWSPMVDLLWHGESQLPAERGFGRVLEASSESDRRMTHNNFKKEKATQSRFHKSFHLFTSWFRA